MYILILTVVILTSTGGHSTVTVDNAFHTVESCATTGAAWKLEVDSQVSKVILPARPVVITTAVCRLR